MNNKQYPIIAARRQHYDTLLWQVPSLGVAAQSFLISQALDAENSRWMAIALWIGTCFIGIAVITLFCKLRFHEVADSKLLEEFESTQPGHEVLHGRRGPWPSAFHVWLGVLTAIFVCGLAGVILTLSSDAQVPDDSPPPELGQHNEEVLGRER